MKIWFVLPVVAFATGPLAAQDPPGGAKAPGGWSVHKAKDGSHSVLFPKVRSGVSNTERAFGRVGVGGKQQVTTCTLKDGRELEVVGTVLTGSADLKSGDVFDLMYDLDRQQPGSKSSQPKEVRIGNRKGREYFVTRKGKVDRKTVVVDRGRVYQLQVTATDRAATEDAVADTFLASLVVHAPKPEKKPAP